MTDQADFDPTQTTEMHGSWPGVDAWVDTQIERLTGEPARPPDRFDQLETQIRRLHAWVTFSVVLVLGMTVIAIVALLQLGGWIRWFA